jgi:hypothetical protein
LPANIHSTRPSTDTTKIEAAQKWIDFTVPITKWRVASPFTGRKGFPM